MKRTPDILASTLLALLRLLNPSSTGEYYWATLDYIRKSKDITVQEWASHKRKLLEIDGDTYLLVKVKWGDKDAV